jgi:type I restriction enzyme M protein
MQLNILQYESKVWATADLLIAASVKQSDFPGFMMPFFALIMVESRLIREASILKNELGEDDMEAFVDEFQDMGLGYNDMVVRQNKTLRDICKNDKTFDVDFHAYLKAFDQETKNLLGVDAGNEQEKFLNISGISGQLKSKKILFATIRAWSEIDLVPFNNSEITTLEEHIKRKWADISAETAGEQYTPYDIIGLISEIIATKIENNDRFLTIYDPTCGGGNLLFGVEDKIKESFKRPIKTFGEDNNSTLYALAKIESRFRTDSDIRYGNTLTGIPFIEKRFDVIVANPPHGIPWKGFENDIKRDETGRFIDLPTTTDGQLLFDLHILHQLADNGIAVSINNGSALFSASAGSGESNIRKHFFDEDYVEAIIQMPTDEFFNTGIYTYLWVFNKNKPAERKDKVMLLNASTHFKALKKSRGSKRKEMDAHNRAIIIQTLSDFRDTDFAKVFPKWHFYYNKQAITLTNIDENGKSIESLLPTKIKDNETVRAKSIKLVPLKIEQTSDENTLFFDCFDITTYETTTYRSLIDYYDITLKPSIAELDYKEKDLRITTADTVYHYDADRETIIETVIATGEQNALGCGKIVVKAALKKATKTKVESIEISVELTPDYQKDYEIVPFSPNEAENQARIADFMATYVTKPFVYLENTVGVEINFNKVFYTPETLRPVAALLADLQALETQLASLENDLNL